MKTLPARPARSAQWALLVACLCLLPGCSLYRWAFGSKNAEQPVPEVAKAPAAQPQTPGVPVPDGAPAEPVLGQGRFAPAAASSPSPNVAPTLAPAAGAAPYVVEQAAPARAAEEFGVVDKLAFGMNLDRIKAHYPGFRPSDIRLDPLDQNKVKVGEVDVEAFGLPFAAELFFERREYVLSMIKLNHPVLPLADGPGFCARLSMEQDRVLKQLVERFGQGQSRDESLVGAGARTMRFSRSGTQVGYAYLQSPPALSGKNVAGAKTAAPCRVEIEFRQTGK